jgi:hypothetical protein
MKEISRILGRKMKKRKQRKVRRVLNKERKPGGNISFSVRGEIWENGIVFPGIVKKKTVLILKSDVRLSSF